MSEEAKHEIGEVAGAATAEKPSAIPPAEMSRLTDDIIAALKTVFDPEIPADIYELGLIYRVDIDDDRLVTIDMTLTTPNCPSAAALPAQVENAVLGAAVGPEPHVGRGARRVEHVVKLRRALRITSGRIR